MATLHLEVTITMSQQYSMFQQPYLLYSPYALNATILLFNTLI